MKVNDHKNKYVCHIELAVLLVKLLLVAKKYIMYITKNESSKGALRSTINNTNENC